MPRTKIALDLSTLSPEILFHIEKRKLWADDWYFYRDNDGNLMTDYLQKIINMEDAKLEDEAGHMIWLSAYAANNPKSDYHYQCDACYDECERRGKPEIYNRAHKNAF